MKPSFSKKGCPYDNACIESFHAILKKEEVYRTKYVSFKEANLVLFQYIEGFYNRKRIHSSIGYKTPQASARLLCFISILARNSLIRVLNAFV